MGTKRPDRVREQVVVYLDARDRSLLEELAERSGLPRTELFRRGLRRLASELLTPARRGGSLEHLLDSATEDDFPPDVAAAHDRYLYGGGYEDPDARVR